MQNWGKWDILKLKTGNNSLLQDGNDVTIVNFATSKNLFVKSTTFQHQNISTFTSTSPDRKTHNQTDHILIDRRWHSHILDVRTFRRADYDNNNNLVYAKVREKLVVSKQEAQQFGVQRFNLRNLLELEVTKQYHVKISNRFPALEILKDSECTHWAWENTTENVKTSAIESLGLHELKHNKPWFDEAHSAITIPWISKKTINMFLNFEQLMRALFGLGDYLEFNCIDCRLVSASYVNAQVSSQVINEFDNSGSFSVHCKMSKHNSFRRSSCPSAGSFGTIFT
jgi:hypothetical protein